ncbi:demethylmenaquinone methyltransferase family [Fusarium longipes]|uniref:Demethylmenaquinone methyltransferase family n=1 Tax=Fusarium longipes TaxID=694270 RepID=A0A395SA13_9HYPO|nr:demethylmenaquinone methyltransferase family [Fusarium longipes]
MVQTTEKPSSNGTQMPKQQQAEDQEFVALFAATDTPAVSDALDKLGIAGQAMNITPLANYEKVTVGPAFTVRYVPISSSGSSKGIGDWIDDVAKGDVVLIDNGGRTNCTVWGDIMTQYAGIRGIAGTVIDGVCRDVNRAITDDYPMFTAGRFMRTAKDRVELAAVNEPVGIGHVHVKPRDIVVADANGVVIIPRDRAREVAEIARHIDESEQRIREMIASGTTLGQARAQLNYHALQRKG